jgi:hypothetical protein
MLDRNISCNRCGTPLSLGSFRCPSCRASGIGFLQALGQGLRKKSAGGAVFAAVCLVVGALIYAWYDADR